MMADMEHSDDDIDTTACLQDHKDQGNYCAIELLVLQAVNVICAQYAYWVLRGPVDEEGDSIAGEGSEMDRAYAVIHHAIKQGLANIVNESGCWQTAYAIARQKIEARRHLFHMMKALDACTCDKDTEQITIKSIYDLPTNVHKDKRCSICQARSTQATGTTKPILDKREAQTVHL